MSFYVILFSYIRNKYIIVKSIFVKTIKNVVSFRNVSFIQNFSYIDFKIWLVTTNNLNKDYVDTKLYTFTEDEWVSFVIETVEGSIQNILNRLGEVEKLRPRLPLLNQEVMKDILGDFKIIEEFEK